MGDFSQNGIISTLHDFGTKSTSVIENELYTLAIIGLLTTVISAFYYLKVIKIIYFDNNKIKFDEIRNISIKMTIFLSCLILSLYFISPSIINSLLNGLFI